MSNTVTISEEEYTKLLLRDTKLRALENFGVDNWEGYYESFDNDEYRPEVAWLNDEGE